MSKKIFLILRYVVSRYHIAIVYGLKLLVSPAGHISLIDGVKSQSN